jgi:hypothetical protein
MVVGIIALINYFKANGSRILGGSGWYSSQKVLLGSETNFGVLPTSAVFADATTTNDSLNQGGKVLTQVIETSKLDTILLSFMVKYGTATSTLLVRQMGSQDGTYYYDFATSTLVFTATTTPINTTVPRGAILMSDSTATTTISIPFDTFGYRFTRFIMYHPDTSTDPNDAVYAFITAIKPEPITR